MAARPKFSRRIGCRTSLALAALWMATPPVLHADVVFGDFEVPATDSLAFSETYHGLATGGGTPSCPGCRAVATANRDSGSDFARVKFSIPSRGTGAYFAGTGTSLASVGLTLAMDNIWSSQTDLREITAFKFKARASTALTVKLSIDGPAFPFGSAGYTRLNGVRVDTVWRWYSIAPKNFKFLDGMLADAKAGAKMVDILTTDSDGNAQSTPVKITARAVAGKLLGADSATSPDFDQDSINVLKHVKRIQFAIDPVYDAEAVPAGSALDPDFAATVADATLDIDSVTFAGMPSPHPRVGMNCVGAFGLLEDFDSTKTDPMTNYMGGYWFAKSDTSSSAPVAGKDSAIGKSKVWAMGQDTADSNSIWSVNMENGAAEMFALLNKGDAKAHPYAGFAELGTGINYRTGRKLTGAKAFEFTILAGGFDETAVIFDKAKLFGVTFKVGKKNVGDDVAFSTKIAFDNIGIGATGMPVKVCVDIDQLKQPAWYTAKNGVKAFTVDSVTQLAWNVSIQKPTDVSAKVALIQVSNVKIYGIDPDILCVVPWGTPSRCREGVKGAGARGGSIHASYQNDLVVSYSVPGTKAHLEIVRLDGSKVASFPVSASATNLSLPVALRNGTYLVVVRGQGSSQSVTLPVLGR